MTMEESESEERSEIRERHAEETALPIVSPRGRLLIASCRSGTTLARRIVERYEIPLAEAGHRGTVQHLEGIDFQFSDGETCVRLEADVRGRDVFLIQALYDPVSGRDVDQNYMAFLIAVRAFREWGARHVTAVLPYLAYARQDKPTALEREPTTAELMADLSIEAGLDGLVVWDPHTRRIPGFYESIRVDALSPLALFADAFSRFRARDEVVAVAPDAGAAMFVRQFAGALGIGWAVASKHRPRLEEAEVSEIKGDFTGKRIAIVLDDMINTGGTVRASVSRLVEEKGIDEIHLGVSHNLCKRKALDHLSELHAAHRLQDVLVTNSVPQTEAFRQLPFLTVRSLSEPLSWAIDRIHRNRSVDGLFGEPLVAKEG